MMKIVGISQRVDYLRTRNEVRDAVDQRLIDFIMACGGLPVPVPNKLSEFNCLDEWLGIVNPDAIILSGGNDIGVSTHRDETEYTLLNYAENKELPVLGICRGMQMMGVRAGAKLKPVENHIKVRHTLSGAITGQVNSYHSTSLNILPANFIALAYSEDGEIEAISHKRLHWEGWMWHPEREQVFSPRDLNRLTGLLK